MSKQRAAAQSRNERRSRRRPRRSAEGTARSSAEAGLVERAADGSAGGEQAALGDRRLPGRQRQALAREVGRVHGNQHLQRALASLRPGQEDVGLVSRQPAPAPAPAAPAEFGPNTMGIVLPAGPLDLGDEHTETFDVTNADQAPPGTAYTWSRVYAGDMLESLSTPDHPEPGHLDLRLRAVAPGSTQVEVVLGYQVPGQRLAKLAVSNETVTVNQPYIDMVYVTREGPGGEALADVERMRVGEYLRANVFLGNVSVTHGALPVRAEIAGLGPLSLQAGRVLGPGEYELLFRADRVGAANLQIKLMPGRTPAEQAPATALSTHVEMPKDRFLDLCSQVNTKIDVADRAARAWLASLSLAYGKAYKTHTDTLSAQAASERLALDLVLGAALAFVPGGIGGVIGASMKAAGRGEFMIDGVKDLTKWGIRTLGSALATAATDAGLNAFPTDPLAWKDQEEVRINSELLVATRQLEQWQDKANHDDPDFFLDFDPVQAMEQSLTVAGKKVTELEPVDQEETANAFEKGMWARWLEQYGYTLASRVSQFGGGAPEVYQYAARNIGKKIERRCEALGLDVEPYARVAHAQVEARAEALNRPW